MVDFQNDFEKFEQAKLNVMYRFMKTEEQIKASLQIHAIFIFCETAKTFNAIQVFCDLLSSKNGKILGPKRTAKDKQFVQVYMSNPDLLYKDKWQEARFGPMAFNIMLDTVLQATYGFGVEII